jgi:hypothetical protein
MHTYRPGNLRDEIPKEGGFGPPRAVKPWKKKKKNFLYFRILTSNIIITSVKAT